MGSEVERELVGSALRAGSGVVRTVFVFLDVPRHMEFRAGNMPLLPEGTIVEFDISLRSPRDPTKTKKIDGPYEIVRSVLKYETGRPGLEGLTHYIEWKPVDAA